MALHISNRTAPSAMVDERIHLYYANKGNFRVRQSKELPLYQNNRGIALPTINRVGNLIEDVG